MTIEVLLHSPTRKEFQERLKSFLVSGPGRIFIVTGGFSKSGANAASDFLDILVWAASAKDRQLDVLVGVFEDQGELQTQRVVDTLVYQIEKAQSQFKRKHPSKPIAIPVRFFGVKKWHAKAIGLTGLTTEFMAAEKVMFGSTNFTESALYGENFETDIYADKSTSAGQFVLSEYMYQLRDLIGEAMKTRQIPGFHDQVMRSLGGRVQVTPTGMTWR